MAKSFSNLTLRVGLVVLSLMLLLIETRVIEKNEHEDESAFDAIQNINAQIKDGIFMEGDIKKGHSKQTRQRRNIEDTKLWSSTQIPYYITHDMSTAGREAIQSAIQRISEVSCLTFQEHSIFSVSYQPSYLQFSYYQGCWSEYVGDHGGKQIISIGRGCTYQHIVIHEILHSLGFWHTHSRPDRDGYVEVKTENILEGKIDDFTKHAETTTIGSYDMKSLMHYGPYAFSRNGEKTIVGKDGSSLSENNVLSQPDIQQLNILYCGGATLPTTTTTTTTPTTTTTTTTTPTTTTTTPSTTVTTTMTTTSTTTPTTTTTTTTPTTTTTTTPTTTTTTTIATKSTTTTTTTPATASTRAATSTTTPTKSSTTACVDSWSACSAYRSYCSRIKAICCKTCTS